MTLTAGTDYTYAPQLLKADGSYFAAMVYVRDYLPPYTHRYVEETIGGNNRLNKTEVGDSWEATDSFTIEVWGAGAYVELSEAATDPTTNGILTLRVPSEENPATGNAYSVMMTIPPMAPDPDFPRRKGGVRIITTSVENVRVVGSASF